MITGLLFTESYLVPCRRNILPSKRFILFGARKKSEEEKNISVKILTYRTTECFEQHEKRKEKEKSITTISQQSPLAVLKTM